MPKPASSGNGCIQVVFVCTGNTCRSPMAEALLRRESRRGGLACRAISAGVSAMEGAPASPESVAVLREWEIDLTAHRSRPLNSSLVAGSDLLVPLSIVHYAVIVERFPAAREKTLLLGSFLDGAAQAPQDIRDPIGGSLADYRDVRDRIEASVRALVRFLEGWKGGFNRRG